jgi:hypothetical protein
VIKRTAQAIGSAGAIIVNPFLIGIVSLLCVVACGGTDVAVGGPADAIAGAGGGPQDPRKAAASYATNDIACTVASDCCVVYDPCRSHAYLVGSNDKDTVRALLDGASMDACTACISPFVQVACEQSQCVAGTAEIPSNASPELLGRLGSDHCGSVATAAPLGQQGSQFGCGG